MIARLQHRNATLVLMLLILLISVFWGGIGINQDAIWIDELTTISHIGGVDGPFTISQVMLSISEISPKHSPLYFGALNMWSYITGWHPITLRWLSVLLGIISIAGIYRLAKDNHSTRLGIYSALFMGTSVFYLTIFHELRMYALLVNFCLLTIWEYINLLDESKPIHTRHWLILVLGLAGLLYTHPFSIFLPISIGIYHLTFVRKNKRWFKITVAFIFAAILYLPWLPVTIWGLISNFDTGSYATDSLTALHSFGYLMSNGNWVLLTILVGVGVWHLRGIKRNLLAIFILAVLSLVLLLFGNTLVGLIPPNRMRYFYMIWSLWILIVAFGTIHLNNKWLRRAAVSIWLMSGIMLQVSDNFLYFSGATWRVLDYPEFHQIVADLSGKVQSDDYLLGFTNTEFVHKSGKRGVSTSEFYLGKFLEIEGRFIRGFETDADIIRIDLKDKVRSKPVVLFTYSKINPPQAFDLAQQILQEHYIFCSIIVDGQYFIADRYVRKGLECDESRIILHYEMGIRAEYQTELTDQVAKITTGWTVPDPIMSGEYSISIQILNSQYENIQQRDLPMLNEEPTQWITESFDLTGLPSGSYKVVLIVYNRETGTRLRGTLELSESDSSDMISIAEISIK